MYFSSAFGDFEAKHLEFAMNARRTPGGVLRNHAEDEFPHSRCGRLPAHAGAAARDPSPIHLETGAVPTHHSVGLHEDKRMAPSRPESSQDDPERAARSGESRLRAPRRESCELLAKRQILQCEVTLG